MRLLHRYSSFLLATLTLATACAGGGPPGPPRPAAPPEPTVEELWDDIRTCVYGNYDSVCDPAPGLPACAMEVLSVSAPAEPVCQNGAPTCTHTLHVQVGIDPGLVQAGHAPEIGLWPEDKNVSGEAFGFQALAATGETRRGFAVFELEWAATLPHDPEREPELRYDLRTIKDGEKHYLGYPEGLRYEPWRHGWKTEFLSAWPRESCTEPNSYPVRAQVLDDDTIYLDELLVDVDEFVARPANVLTFGVQRGRHDEPLEATVRSSGLERAITPKTFRKNEGDVVFDVKLKKLVPDTCAPGFLEIAIHLDIEGDHSATVGPYRLIMEHPEEYGCRLAE